MKQKNLSGLKSPLLSTHRSLPIPFIRTREAAMSPIREFLVKSGLTEQQWRVLHVVMETGPIDATRLADRAGLPP